ncbi:unnamed protein product [Caenorhabditis auriculariae]|uniref:Uncharacterized protein n=1 Tax=Caenorhabditis auriculariae TaxID=2777116 RepID=A0A8S1GVI4_9PELO|nr:unnamed protein product [Caenorhabditis auriculariae]
MIYSHIAASSFLPSRTKRIAKQGNGDDPWSSNKPSSAPSISASTFSSKHQKNKVGDKSRTSSNGATDEIGNQQGEEAQNTSATLETHRRSNDEGLQYPPRS